MGLRHRLESLILHLECRRFLGSPQGLVRRPRSSLIGCLLKGGLYHRMERTTTCCYLTNPQSRSSSTTLSRSRHSETTTRTTPSTTATKPTENTGCNFRTEGHRLSNTSPTGLPDSTLRFDTKEHRITRASPAILAKKRRW
ncbi:unnamed protein product [Callosobruchus maculatus]|uniref:Uncharacterized protein n=1 Tax=Callosobruchus maculatus TaxID=64391 RepID=A0A653C676_CALMS|nr:unnamed protein product [Callosobruchus maculatus]